MGQVWRRKIIILIFFLSVASVFIYLQPSSKIATKKTSLSKALSIIDGWYSGKSITLDKRIIKMLILDDYVNRYYSKNNKTVLLYVGYYLSLQKVGAVHDPLGCFPGQGWRIEKADDKRLKIEDHYVHLTRMIVTKGQKSHLVFYWYQAFDKTAPNTLMQKIYALKVKFLSGREDNAFVRITIPIDSQSINEASNTLIEFIKDFYPLFNRYLKSDSNNKG